MCSISDEAPLLKIPADRDELIRLYTFSESDLELIHQHRVTQNRLGFAVQLCSMRYPGILLGADVALSGPLLRMVASQINDLAKLDAAIIDGMITPKDSRHVLVFSETKAVVTRDRYQAYGDVTVEYQATLYELGPMRALWSSPFNVSVASIAPLKNMDSFAGNVIAELVAAGVLRPKYEVPQRQNGETIRSTTAFSRDD